jgi:hypothetical protein
MGPSRGRAPPAVALQRLMPPQSEKKCCLIISIDGIFDNARPVFPVAATLQKIVGLLE